MVSDKFLLPKISHVPCAQKYPMTLYLGVVVDKIFEVVFGFEDPLGDEVIKDDTHRGREGGVVSDSQPCYFGSVLVVCVGETQLSFKTMDHSTRVIPVDLSDDDVAPVNQCDLLSLRERLSVSTLQ